MAGFFDLISDFFAGIFSSDPNTVRVRKLLRDQLEVIQEVKPAVFSRSTEQLLPGYAQSWFKFQALLAPVQDLFSKTISHPDRKVQDLSFQWLIECALTGDLTERRLALSYDSLKERLAASSADQVISAASNEVNSILADVRRQDTEAINKPFDDLMRLKNLASHSFAPLFKRFGFQGVLGAQEPHFSAAEGSSALPDLLDLYFVLAGIDLSPGLELYLGFLLEKVGPSKVVENRRKMAQILERLRDLLRGPCSPYLTLNLISVLRRDPETQPEVWRSKDQWLSSYCQNLSDLFSRDRDRALREQSESSLESEIRALFPNTPLLMLKSYTAETSDRLGAAGLPSLALVKPFQLLKSLCFAVLKTTYLDAVKKVVLNGFFQDKEWASGLSTCLYAADTILARIEAFDHGLESEGKTSLTALEKYISGQLPISSVPKLIVEKINRQAFELLEAEVRVLTTLALRVQEILTDYKTPQPVYVTNIKGLGGKDQREIIEGLINGYNKSAQFLKIMKHFVVTKS